MATIVFKPTTAIYVTKETAQKVESLPNDLSQYKMICEWNMIEVYFGNKVVIT